MRGPPIPASHALRHAALNYLHLFFFFNKHKTDTNRSLPLPSTTRSISANRNRCVPANVRMRCHFSGVSEGSGKPPEGCSDTDCLSVVLPAAPAVRGTGELRGDSAD